MIWSEHFTWIYFPVRINRKNKTLYKFHMDGTVLCVPWEEMYFTLVPNVETSLGAASLGGCVLDKDGVTVLETFSFGTECESHEGAMRQWEFFRQYMLYGPTGIIDGVKYCMPSDKRESYFTGLERISAQYPGIFFKLLLFPFSFYISIFRFIAMCTNKIVVWPKEVEDACTIEPSDPYVKDYRINPKDLQ